MTLVGALITVDLGRFWVELSARLLERTVAAYRFSASTRLARTFDSPSLLCFTYMSERALGGSYAEV